MGECCACHRRKRDGRRSTVGSEKHSFIKQFAIDQVDCLKDILMVNNRNGMTKRCHYYTTSSNLIGSGFRAVDGDSCLVILEQ